MYHISACFTWKHLAWFSYQYNQTGLQIAQANRQQDIQIAQANRQHDTQSQQNQQQYAVLATYLDHMSALIPTLLTPKEGDGVRVVAKAQTLTALQQLDLGRKKIVLLFLYQARLVTVKEDRLEIFSSSPPSTILQLDSADLSTVNLSGIDLHGISLLGTVNLSNANLSGTLLYESDLYSINLSGAKLEGANLNGSYLGFANLSGTNLLYTTLQGTFNSANLSMAQLNGANLKGANLEKADLSRASLTGVRYNTQPIRKTVNGNTSCLSPTVWPDGFDFKNAGAIVDNHDEIGDQDIAEELSC